MTNPRIVDHHFYKGGINAKNTELDLEIPHSEWSFIIDGMTYHLIYDTKIKGVRLDALKEAARLWIENRRNLD